MKGLANLSIRNKLVGIVLISTILSVLGGFALVIQWNIGTYEQDLIDNTELLASVVGSEVGFWLAFSDCDDAPEAAEVIDKLEDLAWISDAYFLDPEGTLCVGYSRASEDHTPEQDEIPETDDTRRVGDFVHGVTHYYYNDPDPTVTTPTYVGVFFLRATTEPYADKVNDLFTYMVYLMVAVLAGATVLAYLLQGVISKPILDLADMAQRISSHADYSVRVRKPGNDEIGILYDGFNNMLEQIQQRQEDLERSNRDLDQFAYVASHDLKAPLRAIATLSGWIEEDLQGDLSAEASEQMTLLRSRVQRMDQLIDGILQYSRAGRLDSQGERVDLDELLRDLIELVSPPESFQVTIGPDMPTLEVKRLRMEQVFSNLINNAIKYHDREDGRVEITARRQGRFYEFSVCDDGPGIAEEHHEKVFMMFQTLQPRDQVESTGLGLSLVKKLVEEEGGAIHLESKPGHGACFRFTWPVDDGSESLEDVQP